MYCKDCKHYSKKTRFFGECERVFVSNKISSICHDDRRINFIKILGILDSKIYVNADFGCINFDKKND